MDESCRGRKNGGARFIPTRWVAFVALCLVAVPFRATADEELGRRIVAAAKRQVGITVGYDPSYRRLSYPGGDVPEETGVCADVVVRALRAVGLDLQKALHEDMGRHFDAYPRVWGLKRPDKNIDHRRVPNLARYFERHHATVRESLRSAASYRAGDIVTWDLGKGLSHIGIVSDRRAGLVPLIVHNIGSGAREEDILFEYRITGHYRVRRASDPDAPDSLPADGPRSTITARP